MVRQENYDDLSVNNAPSNPGDVPRKEELDEKADQDGGGSASLDNYASIATSQATVGGESPLSESDAYTVPPEVGSEKNRLSLSRAGDLIDPVGAILPEGVSQPSIIHASTAFDNPLGEWYIYVMNYSEHRNCLYYADDIEGPYTEYGVVLSPFDTTGDQAEGPSVLYMPEHDQVWMYYHELRSGTEGEYNNAIQDTYLATAPTSGDGTSFTQYPTESDPRPILEGHRNGRWDDTNLHYATMRRVGNQFYCIYRATDREANSVPFGYAVSSDGIHWHRAKYPPAGGLLHDSWEPHRENKLCRLFPTLAQIGGQLVVLWTQDGTTETRALTWNQLQYAQPDSWTTFADVELGEGDSIDYGPHTYLLSDEFMYRIDWRDY